MAVQNDLGWLYADCRGVPQNDEEAVAWCRKAAKKDNTVAQSFLGWMYAVGRGAPQSDKEAVQWYYKAAEQGNAVAQYFLGRMSAAGQGVSQDDKAAAAWYRRSASSACWRALRRTRRRARYRAAPSFASTTPSIARP